MESSDFQALRDMFVRHEWIDVVQTLAIAAVFGVLIYAIWRLEGQIRAWARMLGEINTKLVEQAVPQNDRGVLGEWVGKAWQHIEKIEARLDAVEKGQPPPPGTRPTDPPL